jgi:hypothetical protein
MEDESLKRGVVHDPQSPTVLTAEQVEQVAGAALSASLGNLVLGGCPACTSGPSRLFKNLAEIVNPAVVNPVVLNTGVEKQIQ